MFSLIDQRRWNGLARAWFHAVAEIRLYRMAMAKKRELSADRGVGLYRPLRMRGLSEGSNGSKAVERNKKREEECMSYYFGKTLPITFEEALTRTIDSLKEEGFGVLTEIDVRETLKKKIGIDFPNYRILGACNPGLAYEALSLENKVGTMLPCNVVVRDAGNGQTEVAAIDPVASMQAINNPKLREAAMEVREKLRRTIVSL